MSHGDRIEALPDGFVCLASSPNSPNAAMGSLSTRRFGLQFHPEVNHTPTGPAILRRFVIDVCTAFTRLIPASIIQHSVEAIRRQVGSQRLWPPSAAGWIPAWRLR